jgi:hypothetical protein
MVYMNVFYALAVKAIAPHTGGNQGIIMVLLF